LAGELLIELENDQLSIQFLPTQENKAKKLYINIAWLGSGYVSRVTRGENRGKKLSNDFIVLELNRQKLERTAEGYIATLRGPVQRASESVYVRC
jgi:hypothetical protein